VTLDLSSSIVVISHLASPNIEDDGGDDDDNHHVNINVTRSTYIKGVDYDLDDDDDDDDDDSSKDRQPHEMRNLRQEIETIFFASSTQSEIYIFIHSRSHSFIHSFTISFVR
jgi:hypothetical protein